MNSNKTIAKIFGTFFILAFVAYGAGNEIVNTIVNSTGGLSSIYANKTQVIFGVILMSLVHTFLNMGLAVIMFRI